MRPITTKLAAQVLGVDPQKLRRWLREGRFAHIKGLTVQTNGFMHQHVYTRGWLRGVAKQLGREPDFSVLDEGNSRGG